MKTVILCGGYGTRIRDVADDIPKPMIPVGRLPILWHLMKYYASFGFDEFVLCLGHKGHVIKDFFVNYETSTRDVTVSLGSSRELIFHTKHDESSWKVTLADTGTETMTGGRIAKIKKYVDGERFFLTYGDGLSDVNLSALLEFHLKQKTTATVTGVRPPGRFGELMINSDGIAQQFNEKPQASEGRISGGFFVCQQEVFEHMNGHDDLVFEQEPMKSLVANKQLSVYQHNGFWQCMDTYRDWQLLNSMIDQDKAPWKIW
ncbi:MAG: glucose-1-phosphate cytidylyltransferase [Actinobacteria bacterium]|nr:glucose-1-phosphate cytidylyltransferase [Actinomycetota bacterium]